MSEKVVILVEDDLFKMEDMLLSIQSILFVAAKQGLSNAPGNDDTEICLLHVIGNNEKGDPKTFGRFKSILEDRQRELMTLELKYTYETVCIDIDAYPGNAYDCKEIIGDKIKEIIGGREYSILLDVILVRKDDKDINHVLQEESIVSQLLYKLFPEHCISYTTYDGAEQTFRKMWAKGAESELPYERFCLDGNVIHKGFKEKIYGQLKIDI